MNDAGLSNAVQGVINKNSALPMGTGGPGLPSLFATIATNVLNPLIEIFFALALIYFIWGVVVYVRNADNEKERAAGVQHIVWGLVGMLVLMSTFAIGTIIQ